MTAHSRGGRGSVLVNLPDAELVTRLLDRDPQALALVYQRHGLRVIAVADAVLQDRAAAEDVCQDVFVQLWHHPERFDVERGTLRGYLVAVTHGRALDRRRSEQARCFVPTSRDDSDDLATASSTATRIWATVSALPVPEADALRLAYFSGTSCREVAGMVDVAEGTVKTRIRSGLLRLRATFIEQGIITPT